MIRRVGIAVLLTVVSLYARTAWAQSADLSVSISNLPANVVPNAAGTATANFTLTVANSGPNPAQTVTFSVVPAVSITSAPWFGGCVNYSDHTQCSIASLATGTNSTTATVTWTNASPSTQTVMASIGSYTNDPNSANNSNTATTHITWQASLFIDQCSLTNFVGAPPGASIPISVSFTNAGPNPISDFVISQQLGNSLTLGSIQHAPAGMPCSANSTAFGCGAVPAYPVQHDSIAFTLNVKPDATPDTMLPLEVQFVGSDIVNGPQIHCGRDQDKAIYVLGPSDPVPSVVQVLPANANPGNTLSSTIDVANNGSYHCRDAVITITAKNGNTLLPLTNVQEYTHSWTCTGTTQVVCSGGVIPAGGGAVQITFSTPLPQDISGTVVTTVTVSSPQDTNTSNNTKSTTTTINPPPPTDVSVTIAANPTHPTPGQNVTYSVGLNNAGSAAALGVTLSVSDSASLPRVSSTLPCSTTTCNIGTMAAGESRTYTVVVHAPNTPGTTVTATAATTASNDSNSSNNQATAQFVVTPHHADLGVAISAPAVMHPGNAMWSVVVSNAGPDAATNASLTFQPPVGTTFMSYVGTTGSFCSVSGVITCSTSGLAAGAQWTLTFQLNVASSSTSPIHASANVGTTDVDGNATNNSASADTRVVPNATSNADLSLAMSATPSVLHPADLITFTYNVTNHGGVPATGVMLHTTYPANITFVSGSPGCDATGCSVGTLGSNQSATFTIYATATLDGYDTATANATSVETDPDLGDNSASQMIAVTPLPSSRRRSSHH